MIDWNFYKGKKVFLTGHTGFKGTWMSEMLYQLGASVTGYGLEPPTKPSLFELCKTSERIRSVHGDIRDLPSLQKVMMESKPEIVIHMAAQPLVRESYQNPVYTYETNVMGTVNMLEAVRGCDSVNSVINVTTDKVYRNNEWIWGYREDEQLNGYDPYSNSKSCSELITDSYRNSFLKEREIAVSTLRAGNVIGGGDFAKDRLIPDCVKAAMENQQIVIRNPDSTRPFQHVLEPITAYLLVAKCQYENCDLAGAYNVGPEEADSKKCSEIVDVFCKKWNHMSSNGQHLEWVAKPDDGPHEAQQLRLDISKIKSTIGWQPVWNIETAIEKVVEWSLAFRDGYDVQEILVNQIREYLRLNRRNV